jgi:hypothetical protein
LVVLFLDEREPLEVGFARPTNAADFAKVPEL